MCKRERDPAAKDCERKAAKPTYCAANALFLVLTAELHVWSSAAANARPSTAKLSILPARLASDSQSTTGRLSAVWPWHPSGPQFQLTSGAINRPVIGVLSLAE